MKTILLSSFILLSISLYTQNTAIPDANFEQSLINLGLDTAPIDGFVPTANIDTVISLDVMNKNISNLTGIEDFTALEVLNCYNNQLSLLNVTQNLQLTILRCSQNFLTTLNVTQNTSLEILSCFENQLTSLNVTQNTALTELLCFNNQLTILDVSQNLMLYNLGCSFNQISSLDVTMLSNLGELNCSANNLSTVDVSQNVGLLSLGCGANPISTIDVSQNLNLKFLTTANNFQITSLDVSQNTALTYLNCSLSPQLTVVDVRNGNNVNFTYFNAMVDTNLKCIYVDDKNAPYLSSWIKDTMAHWVNDTLDCQNITSLNEFDDKSNFLNIYPNPNHGIFNIAVPKVKDEVQITIYNLSGQQIKHLTLKDKGIIDINKQPNGIYFVKVIHQHQVITQKIIKY